MLEPLVQGGRKRKPVERLHLFGEAQHVLDFVALKMPDHSPSNSIARQRLGFPATFLHLILAKVSLTSRDRLTDTFGLDRLCDEHEAHVPSLAPRTHRRISDARAHPSKIISNTGHYL